MNDMYLMVNGKKINLPEEVVKNIMEASSKPDSKDIVKQLENEFFNIAKSKHFSVRREYITTSMEKCGSDLITCSPRLTMKIRLPNCNSNWSYAVFDACKEFCKKNSERWPAHYDHFSPRFLYIHLEDIP